MKYSNILLVLFTSLFFSGCATLNKSECINANWQMIGMEDGAKGRRSTHIGQHREACAEHNVVPNLVQYQSGYKTGISQFCTESSGYAKGKSGYRYNGICPSELSENFLSGYRRGSQLYALSSSIRNYRSKISSHRYELKKIKKKVTLIETTMISSTATSDQRIIMLRDLRDLQKRQGKLESNIRRMEIKSAKKQVRYEMLEARFGYY